MRLKSLEVSVSNNKYMQKIKIRSAKFFHRKSLLYKLSLIVIAFIISLFANGRWYTMIAPWLGPIFLLRFVRTSKPLKGLLINWLVISAIFWIQWRYVLSYFPTSIFVFFALGIGILNSLPYVFDRLLAPSLRGFMATLIFPISWVVMDFICIQIPYVAGFSIVYSQFQNMPLIQLLAVTGPLGLSFLISWHASIVNNLWEQDFKKQEKNITTLVYYSLLFLILLAGGINLALNSPKSQTVAVGIVHSSDNAEVIPYEGELQERLLGNGLITNQELADLVAHCKLRNDELLIKSRNLARSGAKIITWHEYDAHIPKDQEPEFIDAIKQIAMEEKIYIMASLITFQPAPEKRINGKAMENKVVAITPEGDIGYEFHKAKPVPGWESSHIQDGADVLKTLDTEYGRLSNIICADINFPALIRDAGRKNVDILFMPAYEDQFIDPYQRIQAHYRAVENGISIVRASYGSQAGAVDFQGRTLSSMPHFRVNQRSVIAHIPVEGIQTMYPFIGDIVGWICVVLLLAITVKHLFTRNKKEKL